MVAVLALTAFGASDGLETLRNSQLLVANALLGGAVGGALTGDRTGLNRRQREEIELQAELAHIANGLLRHEVLNATSIVNGYTSLFNSGEPPSETDVTAIREAADRIKTTVADVGEVGRARDSTSFRAMDLGSILHDEIDAFGERHPDSSVSVTVPEGRLDVLADHRLRLLLRKLLDLVAKRSDSPTLDIGVSVRHHTVEIGIDVHDTSSSGIDDPSEDPAVGFDHRIVDLLTAYYNGSVGIHTVGSGTDPDSDPDGITSTLSVTLELPRAMGDRTTTGRLGLSSTGLGSAIAVGVFAGIGMGVLSQQLSDLLPVIGALYDVPNPVVGWITHLLHSVVFALLFAAGYTHLRDRVPASRLLTGGLLDSGWGIALWFGAAGFVMPLWLRLAGVPTLLPNLTGIGLFTHLMWGVTVGVLYAPLRDRFSESDRLSRTRSLISNRFRNVAE